MHKDLKAMLRAVGRQGFEVSRTSKGHWRVRDQDGRTVTVLSGTSSDPRAYRNGLAQLKRAGLIWPPPR